MGRILAIGNKIALNTHSGKAYRHAVEASTAGLLYRFDASLLTGYSDGDLVGQLTDFSGADRHFNSISVPQHGVTEGRGKYRASQVNGYPSVQFGWNGVDYATISAYVCSPTLNLTGAAYTIYAVYQVVNQTQSNHYLLSGDNGAFGLAGGISISSQGTSSQGGLIDATVSNFRFVAGYPSPTTWGLQTYQYNQIQRNGTPQSYQSGFANDVNALNITLIGARVDTFISELSWQNFIGHLTYLDIFNIQHDAPTLAANTAALQTKYGL